MMLSENNCLGLEFFSRAFWERKKSHKDERHGNMFFHPSWHWLYDDMVQLTQKVLGILIDKECRRYLNAVEDTMIRL